MTKFGRGRHFLDAATRLALMMTRPKNGLNGRASYLCFRAKMTHGREAEPENDTQPDLRKKCTPGRNIPLLEPEPHMPEEEEVEDAGLQHEGELQNTAAGIRRRQQIVNKFF
ncbi:hypothetical protein NDU88_006622 [Pleurodeles waltl]|uniref:Uncharacterized protein n=1 Tax=Pleurodeles waltl TaxID=8319 RepID=A0AAV7L499_PLEWA|nr:hypothetical protein NDU88_006622 [Pleurodeles waltl]